MEFTIHAPGGDSIEIINGLPGAYNGKLLPANNAIEVRSDFGNILFQNYTGNGFNIWYSHYQIQQKAELIGRGNVPVLELHIQFLNEFINDWDGVGEKLLKVYQYNISYTPFLSSRVKFQPGKTYHTFDIHFDLTYLQKLAPHFETLHRFLEKVEKGIPADISGIDRFLTPGMIAIINQLLNCPYRNGASAFYIESKVIELLLLVLQECSNQNPLAPIKLSEYDKERLHEARELLVKDFENPLSIIQLSRKVGINDFKLKKGFKYLFGTTVFEYVQNEKMQKAKQLLLDTELAIDDIALFTGYEFVSNFNKAFKRHFGYTAAYLRKHRKL